MNFCIIEDDQIFLVYLFDHAVMCISFPPVPTFALLFLEIKKNYNNLFGLQFNIWLDWNVIAIHPVKNRHWNINMHVNFFFFFFFFFNLQNTKTAYITYNRDLLHH